MGIGKKIKEKREAIGISQDELAKRLGYKSRSSINKIELELSDIPQSKISDFAHALSTTPSSLMDWDEEPIRHPEFGNHQENLDYLQKNPELLELYKNIYESDNLRILFDKAQQLDPKDMEMVLELVDRFIKEVDSE